MTAPRVSVVVSSFERPRQLRELLDALARQTLAREEYEVVIVDNGSGPATGVTLALAAPQLADALELRTIRLEQTLGPAGGRNRGWRAARAPLIAFTDDDCLPEPGWLAELLAAAATAAAEHPGDELIVQGATSPPDDDLAALRHTLFTRIVRVSAADGRYETCNILYPRELLTRLDGFDESFRPRGLNARPVGEDTDLGWRARAVGARSVYAPQARVRHEIVRFSPWAKLAHQTRWAGAPHLFKVHPEAREILFRRVFWNVWHYMLLQVILGLAAPRWLRRLLIGRYLGAMTRRARECGAGAWAVPYLIAEDVTEAAVLAAASIRERTPLL